MDDNEIKAFYHQVKQLTAQKIGIEGYEWKFGAELMDAIKNKNNKVFNLLNEFLKAYQKWHEFHKKIESEGNSGKLSEKENDELMKNISERDKTRNSLIEELGQ